MSRPTWVRDVAVRYRGRKRLVPNLKRPQEAAAFGRGLLTDDAREHFIAVFIDARHTPIGTQIVSIGTASQSLVHPREVFQPAILLGASAVFVMHNHPSGDPSPSPEDHTITRRLARAGDILGVKLLDHLIIGDRRRYFSFSEAGVLPEMADAEQP